MTETKTYSLIACHVLWREFSYFASQCSNTINPAFVEQGLHNTPDILRERLQTQIDAIDDKSDAILLGYGLCSNGIEGLCARTTPIVVARAHDCITYLLGSKERYRDYFDSHPGTYWYSPGWIETNTQPGKERYESQLQEYRDKFGDDNAEYLMKMEQGWMESYSNAAYTDLGFGKTAHYREYTRDCAKWLNWHCDELTGSPQLIINMLEGNWEPEHFLIVNPGQKIVASHDNSVIRAETL